MYEPRIPPVDLYGSKTWSLMLRKEQDQRVFHIWEPRKTFGPKGDEEIRVEEMCIMSYSVICTLPQILLGS
jgi:hypothetical protein